MRIDGARTRTTRREQLRRAVEDGERLYRKRMHDPDGLSAEDESRINGILTRELADALALVDGTTGGGEWVATEPRPPIPDAEAYEKHTAKRLIELRGAVIRYLRFMYTDRYENEHDSHLSLLDDMEKAVGRDE